MALIFFQIRGSATKFKATAKNTGNQGSTPWKDINVHPIEQTPRDPMHNYKVCVLLLNAT